MVAWSIEQDNTQSVSGTDTVLTRAIPGPFTVRKEPETGILARILKVVWDVGDYQMTSRSWTGIIAPFRLPALLEVSPSTAWNTRVNGAVLFSPGLVSPATRLPPARAFPSKSVTSGPTGPKMSWSGSSSAALSATFNRLSAAFSLRSWGASHSRVDSGRGQDRTLRGMAPVECAICGWS